MLSIAYGQRFQLLPGRADPADDSRFTIEFHVGDQTGIIDGRLLDDDTATLEVRGAPPRPHPALPASYPASLPSQCAEDDELTECGGYVWEIESSPEAKTPHGLRGFGGVMGAVGFEPTKA